MKRAVSPTLATMCIVLVAGCGTTSSGGGGRHDGATTSAPTATSVTTATTTTTTPPPPTYQVKRGDTLTTIAKQFHVSVAKIVALNQIANPDRLTEGQTLTIPPIPPVVFLVTPDTGPQGQAFQLDLTGAKPAERITFEVDSPAGKYVGGAHTASEDGAVTAKYQTSPVDATGTYNVTATGDMGTLAKATFDVVAAPTTVHT
jgi:spore germination protein YaaH